MHPLTWLGLLSLAAISFGFCTDMISRFWIAWAIQLADPRSWPLWVVYPLWGAVCWQAVKLPYGALPDRRVQRLLQSLIVLAVVGLFAWHCGLHLQPVRRYYYNAYYVSYITGPMSRFLVDGYWDWKIFILPTAGLVSLGFLTGLMVRVRKQNKQNPHSMPIEAAFPLWIDACRHFLNQPVGRTSVRRLGIPIFAIAVILWCAWYYNLHTPAGRHQCKTYYASYITVPITHYFRDGYWDWKIFILPAAAVTLTGLLVLMIRFRKKNNDSDNSRNERKK